MTDPIPTRTRLGVIAYEGRIVIYESVNAGYRAQVQGTREQLGISPALRAAIEADQKRIREKGLTHG